MIQTTLTAVNTARNVAQQATQITNEMTQIANQIQQISQGAQNLLALPLSMSNELNQLMGRYQQLLQQAQGISYQYSSVKGQFERLYDAGSNGQWQNILGYSAQLMTQLRQASTSAMQSQGIVERLGTQATRLQRALAASEAAQGNLQVEQAGNQLSGVLAEQNAALLELVATTGRAQTSLIAAQGALDDAARQRASQLMEGWGQCTDCANLGMRELPKLR